MDRQSCLSMKCVPTNGKHRAVESSMFPTQKHHEEIKYPMERGPKDWDDCTGPASSLELFLSNANMMFSYHMPCPFDVMKGCVGIRPPECTTMWLVLEDTCVFVPFWAFELSFLFAVSCYFMTRCHRQQLEPDHPLPVYSIYSSSSTTLAIALAVALFSTGSSRVSCVGVAF